MTASGQRLISKALLECVVTLLNQAFLSLHSGANGWNCLDGIIVDITWWCFHLDVLLPESDRAAWEGVQRQRGERTKQDDKLCLSELHNEFYNVLRYWDSWARRFLCCLQSVLIRVLTPAFCGMTTVCSSMFSFPHGKNDMHMHKV